MKERGMIFNAEMVRALLDGRKTQTRRIVNSSTANLLSLREQHQHKHYNIDCQLGAVGDRIWVRETWMADAPRDGTWGDVEFYGCKGSPLSMIPTRYRLPEHCIHRASWTGSEMVGWRPSIHMPRWASRILLEITDVRAERLKDISEADARAEGVLAAYGPFEAQLAFHELWRSIYGQDEWQTNPWVWVIEFKRINAA